MSTEPMSIEDAEAALAAMDPDLDDYAEDEEAEGAVDDADDTVDEETESESETPADDDQPEDPETEGNEEGADDEEEDEPEAVIDPPQFWDAEGRENFAKLPKEAQEIVRRYEEQRVAAVGRKMEEVAEDRKIVQAQRQQLDQQLSNLDAFKSDIDRKIAEYEDVDWVRAARELDPRQYAEHQANYQSLLKQRENAISERSKAETESLKIHTQENLKILKEKDPEFFVPENKGQLFMEVGEYLSANGYDPDTLKWASAGDLMVAKKAMLYDRMQEQMKQRKTPLPKQAERKVTKAVKPGAPPVQTNSQSKRLKQLQSKRSLSASEADELLLLRG